MNPQTLETVGERFRVDLIQDARNQTLKVLEAAARTIVPGTTEAQARETIKALFQASGSHSFWHAPQIRFGRNTLCAFGEPGAPEQTLAENDVFFLDLGPIFGHHEGDVGRTFAVGNDPEMRKIAADVELLWNRVRERWSRERETGAALYAFAARTAGEIGWQLSLYEASGHRIADFPHVAKQRGSVEALDFHPSADRWILEMHIKHPTRPFGAFYEDLLN